MAICENHNIDCVVVSLAKRQLIIDPITAQCPVSISCTDDVAIRIISEDCFGKEIRAHGRGLWLRTHGAEHRWDLIAFHCFDFWELDTAPLSEAVEALRQAGRGA